MTSLGCQRVAKSTAALRKSQEIWARIVVLRHMKRVEHNWPKAKKA